jgi:hypothetical protein
MNMEYLPHDPNAERRVRLMRESYSRVRHQAFVMAINNGWRIEKMNLELLQLKAR